MLLQLIIAPMRSRPLKNIKISGIRNDVFLKYLQRLYVVRNTPNNVHIYKYKSLVGSLNWNSFDRRAGKSHQLK